MDPKDRVSYRDNFSKNALTEARFERSFHDKVYVNPQQVTEITPQGDKLEQVRGLHKFDQDVEVTAFALLSANIGAKNAKRSYAEPLGQIRQAFMQFACEVLRFCW